ncbi:MAG: 30S ribosomal protein S8e [Archaeoglobaceae archaeon]
MKRECTSMIWHGRSRRKPTGGLYKAHRKKRKYEIGRPQIETLIGERKVKKIRVKGGSFKLRLFSEKFANVYDPTQKKVVRAEIKTVVENKAHVHYARRNVITKGAIILTSVGKAKVTNRPNQEGIINAVLIEGAQKTQ